MKHVHHRVFLFIYVMLYFTANYTCKSIVFVKELLNNIKTDAITNLYYFWVRVPPIFIYWSPNSTLEGPVKWLSCMHAYVCSFVCYAKISWTTSPKWMAKPVSLKLYTTNKNTLQLCNVLLIFEFSILGLVEK